MNFLAEQHLKQLQIGLLATIIFILCNFTVIAEIKLPKVFSSNMVLQRDMPVKIWGWADKREKITIIFHGDTTNLKADRNGKWETELSAVPAGGPFELVVKGKNEIRLTNILVGDVWVCSGQSNMEFHLQSVNDAKEEIAVAKYPRIRLFTVQKNTSTIPLDDCESEGWAVCIPESAASFSAVGYFFGKKLIDDLDVAIGLIHTSWGGTNVETWTSANSIGQIKGFEGIPEELEEIEEFDEATMLGRLVEKTGPLPEEDLGMKDGIPVWASPLTDFSSWKEMEIPQLWESAGLKGLNGIVWFQKTFELDQSDLSGEIEIHLGRINDSDITYLNGSEIGKTIEKHDKLRIYRPDKSLLKVGKNILVVRVEDIGNAGGIYGRANDMFVKFDNKKISLSGTWNYKIGKGSFRMDFGPNSMPSLLYNAMLNPLIPFAIKGAIWYQGESNANRAYQYRTLFPNMISNWREQWDQGDFPFFFVQLANFMAPSEKPMESAWAELREAQTMALSLPNTGMATIIDIGEANDIHPKNKQDVGRRLALSALKVAYNQDVVYSGPTFKEMQIDGIKATISFDNIGSGYYLKNKYGYVNGFTVAGEDKVFHWAQAQISGDKIIVTCDQVEKPVAVRYGWANNPDDLNLYNLESLPAVPFRTDDWPGITINNTYR